ncbi:GNAT family N-acetyltransferase [Luteimonas sp. RIT-PG2_3]
MGADPVQAARASVPAPATIDIPAAGTSDRADALPPIPWLQTRRLRLRPLQVGDRDLYLRTYCDAGVMRHVGPPLTAEAAGKGFELVLRQQSATPARAWYWVLVPRDSDELKGIGLMALVFDAGRQTAELGLLLAPHAHVQDTSGAGTQKQGTQGQGHASAAIAALLDWLAEGKGPGRLWTRHLPANPAARGLMQRLHFLLDGEHAGYLHWSMDRARWADVGGLVREVIAA